MVLSEGIYLCDGDRFIAEPTEGRTWEDCGWEDLGVPPTKADWDRFSWDGDLQGQKLCSLTTVEDLRVMPPWLREQVLPVLVGGGTICLLPLKGQEAVLGRGWALKDGVRPQRFWIRVVFYLFS